MREPIILFVVEGEKRDYRFVQEMERCFMAGSHKVSVINVPASQNIYMLYQKLVEDDFETDVVEVLRESVPEAREKLEGVSRRAISQVYLFFDFDPHQNNLAGGVVGFLDAIAKMLEVFDNETENGKLYISYPMVEALYDYRWDYCQTYSGCFLPLDGIVGYKEASGDGNPKASLHMSHAEWKEVIEVFVLRVKCLLGFDDIDFDLYRRAVTPLTLFCGQRDECESGRRVFVLSAFPEFLLDYFKKDFWNSHVKRKRPLFESCDKAREL